jgi:hypothetical protein
MSDVVQEAAQAIVPLLSAGAGAAAHDLAEQVGARVSDAVVRVLSGIRERFPGSRPRVADVEDALREALAGGRVTEADLRSLVVQAGRVAVQHQHAEHSIFNAPVDVQGDFHA